MSVRRIKAGTTDVSVVIRIIDSTDGTPETGVVFNSAGIDLWYRREGAASTDITEATLSALTDAHSDGGFLHINDGWYRLDLPDAACASGVSGVQIGGTVTGMVVLAPYIELPVNTEEDVYTRIGAPAGASVSADIAAIEAQTDDIGAAGAGLTAIPWNAAWDAEVQSEVEDGLVAHRLDELLNADSDIDGAAPPTVGSVFHELMSKTAGSFTFDQTTDSLEAVRDKETDIETDTQDIQGRLPAALTGDGNIKADAIAISGDATAADNAEAFFDGTGYAGTNNVIPTVTTVTNLTNAPTAGDLTAAMKASVNAEVLDVLNVDTFAEPGQEAPAATNTLVTKIGYIFKFLRNKITQTSTTLSIFADDGTTVDNKSTVSDDGTTYTRGEIVSGP